MLDFSPVTHLDATGIHGLEQLIEHFANSGTQLILCNPSVKVVKAMEAVGLPDMLGRDNIFVTVSDAVTFCSRQLAERGGALPQMDVVTSSDH